MNIRYFFNICILTTAFPAAAQFDQTIAVEGHYTPEVIRLDRINAFPHQEKFSLETSPLAYDASGVTASFAPSIYSMPATGWRDTRKVYDNRGYLDFGLGSWLNSTLSAGYRFVQNESTVVGVRLQHNSTSLWKPKLSSSMSDTRQWRYDEALGVYGSHRFNDAGSLDAAVDYHIGNFNYYAFNPQLSFPLPDGDHLKAPKQTLNDIAARIGWQSASGEDEISWNAAAGVRYFGYRWMYDLNTLPSGLPDLESKESTKETDINIKGGIAFPFSKKSVIGLDIDSHILLYKYKSHEGTALSSRPKDIALITLTPYYRFAIDRLNLRLGLDIDITNKGGSKEEENNYSALYFSPDVMLDYDAGAARFFLHLLGGSRLNTLASGAELNYYQQPYRQNTRTVYTPLDGELGVTFGPFSGFSASLRFAYKIIKREFLGGWYQERLNYGNLPSPSYASLGLPDIFNGFKTSYSFLEDETYNIHGYSIGANLSYDLGKIFNISASGAYQPQNGEKGYFNGLDRPRWVAGISATTNPWNTLKFVVAYNYRGIRNTYIRGTYHNDKGFDETFITSTRLPDVTSLDFGVSYSFTDNFSIWLQADNLLNRKIDMLPGLPCQGLTAAGGVAVTF